MDLRLNGINPLGYMGVNPYTPVPFINRIFSPTSNDLQNFTIGSMWLNTTNKSVWMLVAQANKVATWVELTSSSSGPILTITGNIGGPISPAGGNIFIETANSTVEFIGNPASSTEQIDFALSNLLLGSSGSSITSGARNVGFGENALLVVTIATDNTAIGSNALSGCTSGGFNTAIGSSAAAGITTGQSNIAIGEFSAANWISSESSNISIGSAGVIGDANVIRIGTQGSGLGQQDICFIAGITGVNVGSVANVVSIATGTGKLGTTAITAGANITITPGANTITIAASSDGFLSAQIILTNSQVKNIKATPITIVAAGGAGTTIWVVATSVKLDYGGTNAFVNTDGNPLALFYTNNAGQAACADLLDNSAIIATTSTTRLNAAVITLVASSALENLPLVISSLGATEISGNAANNNTITVSILYKIVTL